jgi:serine/threonine-protein kinase HipA
LAEFVGRRAVVVTRYDRVKTNAGWRRVHQEDMCQTLGVAPARKYQSDGGPSPAAIASLLRRAMPARTAEAAVRQFADALVWNWIIGGTDAHAKNYSLLLSGSQVRLAPLYDIASALPYAHERKLTLAMKFGGDYRLHTQRRSTWRVLAEELAIDDEELRARATVLVAATGDAFASVAGEISAIDAPLSRALVEAVSRRAEWCTSILRR